MGSSARAAVVSCAVLALAGACARPEGGGEPRIPAPREADTVRYGGPVEARLDVAEAVLARGDTLTMRLSLHWPNEEVWFPGALRVRVVPAPGSPLRATESALPPAATEVMVALHADGDGEPHGLRRTDLLVLDEAGAVRGAAWLAVAIHDRSDPQSALRLAREPVAVVRHGDGWLIVDWWRRPAPAPDVLATIRLRPDGGVDGVWGDGGLARVELPFEPFHVGARAVHGRVLAWADVVDGPGRFFRLGEDGSIDGAFADAGFFELPAAHDVMPLEDGSMLLVGGTAAKVDARGTLDRRFGQDGIAPLSAPAIRLRDGRFVGRGDGGALRRLHADGRVDTTWLSEWLDWRWPRVVRIVEAADGSVVALVEYHVEYEGAAPEDDPVRVAAAWPVEDAGGLSDPSREHRIVDGGRLHDRGGRLLVEPDAGGAREMVGFVAGGEGLVDYEWRDRPRSTIGFLEGGAWTAAVVREADGLRIVTVE